MINNEEMVLLIREYSKQINEMKLKVSKFDKRLDDLTKEVNRLRDEKNI